MAVGLLVPSITNLINDGFSLVQEKEKNCILYQGYIESVQEPSKRIWGYKDADANGSEVIINGERYSEGAYGADITIDGQLYFAATSGDFQVGDRVVISYLPKSHIIMSMYAAPEEEAEENPNNNEVN